ncbi:MAG: hypothetical protein Q8916_01660 [Bacteroidota bacterium]|nr:hypothetical protein [Bacteroidota bacterium]MDP4229093.1 hypothetical protein [Bacteroidota bacterium]MDP4235033.1 hypothetical protein [Bacteroidota bacterium]
MKNKLSIFVLCTASLLLSSCSGLFVGNKGDFFHTSLGDTSEVHQMKSVGVYVFSNGETRGGVYNFLESTSVFPDEVQQGAKFYPDTANSGPSLELANAITKELLDRGYTAHASTNLPQGEKVTLEDCIADAKKQGYDGVFIAYYTGFNQWSKVAGVTYGWNTRTTHINVYEGYMYITNSGFFNVSNGEELWKNSYYGVVENAHVINFYNEPFTIAVPKALYECSGDSYMEAASHAAKVIFDPPMWHDSFKEFPSKGEKKKKRL